MTSPTVEQPTDPPADRPDATEPAAGGVAPADDSPAWGRDQLAGNPHELADKSTRIRDMFAAISRSYDLNNRVHSLWRDQAWRRVVVRKADVQPGDRVLDVACGTGDLTQAFAKTQAAEVIGLDFTQEMLDLAEVKRQRQAAAGKITYLQGDAMALPFEDDAFDILSIAYGIRNVQRPEAALAEFARVLKPGGRLVILEFDHPRSAPVRWLNDLYAGKIMPLTASLIAGDRSGAYHYLPKSVSTFMTREAMLEALTSVGFGGLTVKPLGLGVCACYRGVR